VNIDDAAIQQQIAKLVVKDELSVRKTEELVRQHQTSAKGENKKTAKDPLSFEYQKLRADLRLKFGRNVELRSKEDGSGKIEIQFSSKDDLQKLLEALGR